MEKLHEGLLKASYGSYRDIGPNLRIILFDMGEPVTDEAELEEAERLGCDLEWQHTKFTTEHLLECLTSNFQIPEGQDPLDLGVDLEEVLGPYSEKYDAYYMRHSDFLDMSGRFFEGERAADGTVRLYYDAQPLYYMKNGEISWALDGYRMCATLVPNPDAEGCWRMISNTIAE